MTSHPPSVIVVGAGIIGASVTWHLAEKGATVTIVSPADGIGGTATPNSFAWINANRGNARHYYELRRRSMQRWRKLTDKVNGLSELVRWTGTVQWNHPETLASFLEEHTAWGYRVERVDTAEVAKIEPSLTGSALPPWAAHAADEGSVEPALAAEVLLKDAQARYGATLVETTVTAINMEDGRVTGVTTNETTLNADHVVIVTGLGSVQLCATAGITLPVYARPGLLAHSKPLEKRLLNGIVLSSGPHVRQTVAGRLVVGADFGGGGGGHLTDPEEQRQAGQVLIEEAKKLFREEDARLLELDFVTVGERPQPQDGLPIIDAAVLPGLAVAVMHSGVTLAAVVGDSLAKTIVKGEVDEALQAFSLRRFTD
ncbi:hypothetical protein SEUCBS139899_006741 [Sporothrix eucalyptigena]|uniref:FAD dependent oxidoreductase domain-containing protein n=1 Tax=Sporothrix eucalyptigena TaxID=1812306 RepID=A0ABP0CI25_9PEZI